MAASDKLFEALGEFQAVLNICVNAAGLPSLPLNILVGMTLIILLGLVVHRFIERPLIKVLS